MSGHYPDTPLEARVSRTGLPRLDRWMLAPVAVEIAFAAVQVLHTF